MITLMLIFLAFIILAVLVTVFTGLIAICPAVLIVIGLALIDCIVFKIVVEVNKK